ncbi:hypothetical protein AMTR_s00053p00096150 [Amborella trichopoda]|uniref:Uncharacterized protein n=1 Tax=Amborella trichopoda TaxID=13333 RepID=W1PDB5_AMBTC|nr:hypothetical protein AMTR_s00053p00096150 [Amborella trichopoda]
MPKFENQVKERKQQPPPGYPQGSPPQVKSKCPHVRKKGDRGFIEGWYSALA